MFKGRHFDRSVILLCVRRYLAYNLSLPDLEEMMAERGLSVDHSTVHRWVVHFSPQLLEWSCHVNVRGSASRIFSLLQAVPDAVFQASMASIRWYGRTMGAG